MSIPAFQSFMLPLLRLTAKTDVTVKAAIAPMREEFSLTAEDIAELIPSGQSKVVNRITWTFTYLFKAGLLERPARGVYRITPEGKNVLAQNPEQIDVKFLNNYESFRNFNSTNKKTGAPPPPVSEPENPVTPDERLAEAYEEIESALLSDIKEQLLKISPSAFERLIIELMKGLKYGARGLAQHVGGSGDGGLDGLVTEDILGLDSIYLQAKRYTDAPIGREKIQAFAGAMDGKSVTKGVFVTTSTFTKNAVDYAATSPKHLKLIDGDELARLMFEHGIGVRVHKTMEIKRLDLDFFSDLEE